uniref:Transposase (putative) gypsy type domain-containing protein n=1 Tax=Triticum urartu TaxID=4572 RepID=A0A8R7QVL3_TRIUA
IPEELTRFLAGNLPVCAPPDGAVGVYADALEAGMHFPLHDFFREVLRHFGLAPSQFMPNEWRIMAGFVVLCDNTGVEPPPLAVFRHFFSLRVRGD